MAEVVEADGIQPYAAAGVFYASCQSGGLYLEHEIGRGDAVMLDMLFNDTGEEYGDVDGAAAGFCLGCAEGLSSLDEYEVAFDADAAVFKVEVRRAQCEHFAAAHSCPEQKLQGGVLYRVLIEFGDEGVELV